jgi:hypothetical protein
VISPKHASRGLRSPVGLCLLLASLLPVVTLACGTDDGRVAFAAAYCEAYRPCCSVLKLLTDTNQCSGVVLAVPPNARFDKTAAADCLSGLAQATNQGLSCSTSFAEPSSCQQVFVSPPGTKAVGAACDGNLDCMPIQGAMVSCLETSQKNENVSFCQSETLGQLGSTPCFGEVENGVVTVGGGNEPTIPVQAFLCDVDDGLYCDGTACVALKQPGASCETSDECVRTAYCDLDVNQCASLKGPGAACNWPPIECQAGTSCGIFSLTCDPEVDLGEPCTGPQDCTSGGCANHVCTTPAIQNRAYLCSVPS